MSFLKRNTNLYSHPHACICLFTMQSCFKEKQLHRLTTVSIKISAFLTREKIIFHFIIVLWIHVKKLNLTGAGSYKSEWCFSTL